MTKNRRDKSLLDRRTILLGGTTLAAASALAGNAPVVGRGFSPALPNSAT
jgi:hypothetical protein